MVEDWVKEKWARELNGRPMTPAPVQELQMERLRQMLVYVKENSPYYQMKYRKVYPHKLRTLKDFGTLAFTFPQEVSAHGAGMLCVPQKAVERIVTQTSSGSTGQVKRICFSGPDQERTLEFFAQGLMEMGLSGKDAMFVLFPCRRPGSVGELLCRAGTSMGLDVYPRESVDGWAAAARLMEEKHINCVLGLPGQVLGLAEMTPQIKVRSALLSADYVPDGLRRRIETRWDAKVHEHYGMTEMGFAGGMSQAAGDGYCLRTPDLYFEIVDESGCPVPAGTAGEVVFTSLTAQAMPLVRYRTGDVASWKDMGNQADGVMYMEKVRGRLRDGVRCPDGWLLTTAGLDDVIFSSGRAVHYEACYTDGLPGHLDLTLFTVYSHGLNGKPEVPEEMAAALEGLLLRHGVRLKLRAEPLFRCSLERLGKKRIQEAEIMQRMPYYIEKPEKTRRSCNEEAGCPGLGMPKTDN